MAAGRTPAATRPLTMVRHDLSLPPAATTTAAGCAVVNARSAGGQTLNRPLRHTRPAACSRADAPGTGFEAGAPPAC